MGGQGDRPKSESRWWVDQGAATKGEPVARPPARFGNRFFRAGEGFDQHRAQHRLTDLNLHWFEEAETTPGAWTVLPLLARERFHPARVQKVIDAFALPPQARGVLADSGQSLRAIATGDPPYARLVEVRLGGDNTFDAWLDGEWVREVAFRSFQEALRRGPRLLRDHLTAERIVLLV